MHRKPTQSSWLVIALLAFVPLLMVLGNSVLIPTMPQMQTAMHVTKFQVSLLITLFSVPAGLVIPIAGFLSDRLRRKWIVAPSLLLFGIGGVIAGAAAWWMPRPYVAVLIGRVIQGIGASGTAPIAMAWVGDLFTGSDRSRVLGIHEAGNAFGKVVSPVLGAAVALIAWWAAFFIFPLLCLPLAAGVWWLIPDKKKPSGSQSVREYLGSLKDVIRREGRWLSVAYLTGAAALFNLFGVLFYLSDQLETQQHIAGVRKGLILAIPLLVLSTTSFATGLLIQKRKLLMKWLMVIGLALLGASLLSAVWMVNKTWPLIGVLSVGALGTGMVLPCLNMFITSAVSQARRGIVTSFYGSVRFLGVAFGPPVYTWLLGISTRVLFFSVAGLAWMCAALTWWLIRPTSDGDSPQANRDKAGAKRRIRGRLKARA